jgi:hypothetical protein
MKPARLLKVTDSNKLGDSQKVRRRAAGAKMKNGAGIMRIIA